MYHTTDPGKVKAMREKTRELMEVCVRAHDLVVRLDQETDPRVRDLLGRCYQRHLKRAGSLYAELVVS